VAEEARLAAVTAVRPRSHTRKQKELVDATAAIRTARPERIDFLHTTQCQCGLAYRNPGDAFREWDRKQGFASLLIEAGTALDPTFRDFVKLGLPFGEKPRLVLIHLASECIRTGNPVVDVQDSMTAFARSLGLDTNGPSLRHLKDPLARLAAATVRFGVVWGDRAVQINTQFVSALDLWYPAEPGQRMLWSSTVCLGTGYSASLTRHAVPPRVSGSARGSWQRRGCRTARIRPKSGVTSAFGRRKLPHQREQAESRRRRTLAVRSPTTVRRRRTSVPVVGSTSWASSWASAGCRQVLGSSLRKGVGPSSVTVWGHVPFSRIRSASSGDSAASFSTALCCRRSRAAANRSAVCGR
jgi:hypothetical protein